MSSSRSEVVGRDTYMTITRKDAADIIALLAGQLAGVSVAGAMGGACPTILYRETETGVFKKLTLVLDMSLER